MNITGKNESTGLAKSILAAHLILVLHIVLVAGLGCLILFFNGIVQYMVWILIIGSAGIFITGLLIRRQMQKEGKQLREILSLPILSGRTIEVSILGGMASIRLEKPNELLEGSEEQRLIESSPPLLASESYHLRELSELVELLNKNLITLDEYNQFKTKLINS